MHTPAISRHSRPAVNSGFQYVGVSVCPDKIVSLWKFHQIYNLGGAVENKGELIRLWGRKVKGRGHDEIECKSSTLGSLKVMHLNVKVTDNLSGEGIGLLVNGSPPKTVLFQHWNKIAS